MPAPKKKSQVKEADRLFSLWVRSVGVCESGRLEHAGALQCAHGISRRYRAVRWDRRNAYALCQGCHVFYTHRPLEWEDWLRARWGANYEPMRALAMSGSRPDMDALLVKLRAEVKAIPAV